MKELLSGNEAIARGAYEAGVQVAAGYPGTPSTEILQAVATYHPEIYCEWAPNEKVAFEVAAGAALTGVRAIATMKHVGLNVAADPLMTLTYTGVAGGFVACVADDPGMHSSQNEQDTRHYARFARIPILEPADSQEALDFLKAGLDISEQYQTPVILRSTTRISHSRTVVQTGERQTPRAPGFEKNPQRFVPVPVFARGMRVRVEERLGRLAAAAAQSPLNRLEWRDRSLGIIAEGIAYQYVREIFPEASVLKIGWVYPFPDSLLREFAAGVKRLLVVEELDDILEQHLKAMGIECEGRSVVPGIGELSQDVLQNTRDKLEGRSPLTVKPPAEAADLPPRPPVLCPGCPHRGVFHALGKFDVVVTGDIGCYSLGCAPPLSRMDTILCMGGGISMAHGMQKAGEPRKVVGMVGDSTFFHSGITGLLDIAYNRGLATIIVVDNRTTAMTGHQDHPGTGRTLMGESAPVADIATFGRACGLKRIHTVDPYDAENTIKVLRECLEGEGEPALIISRAPCPLAERSPVGAPYRVLPEKCKLCKQCLKLACPALERTATGVVINEYMCGGCGLCAQVCRFEAIERIK